MELFFQIYTTFVIVLLFMSLVCYYIFLVLMCENRSEDICDIMEQVSHVTFVLGTASFIILFFISVLIAIWK